MHSQSSKPSTDPSFLHMRQVAGGGKAVTEQEKQVAGAAISRCIPPRLSRHCRVIYNKATADKGERWVSCVVSFPLGKLNCRVRLSGTPLVEMLPVSS